MYLSTRCPVSVQARLFLLAAVYQFADLYPQQTLRGARRTLAAGRLLRRRTVRGARQAADATTLWFAQLLLVALQVSLGQRRQLPRQRTRMAQDERGASLPTYAAPALPDAVLDAVVGPEVGASAWNAAPCTVCQLPLVDCRCVVSLTDAATLHADAVQCATLPAIDTLDLYTWTLPPAEVDAVRGPVVPVCTECSADATACVCPPPSPAPVAARKTRVRKTTSKSKTAGKDTDDRCRKAMALVHQGQSRRAAAKTAGVAESTLRNWIARTQAEHATI
jgi:hypothetical protein